MKVKHLQWDSTFFGFSVGKIHLDKDEDLASLRSILALEQFEVIYIFIEKSKYNLINEVKKFATQIEEKLIYTKKIKRLYDGKIEGITTFTSPINAEITELAWISGEHSRFKKDPNFEPHFKRLYRHWIEMSSSDMVDTILVSHEEGKLSGFVTLLKTNNLGSIGLIAVHPDFQRKNIGTLLMKAADIWYMKNGCIEAEVSTQKSNISACGLYRKTGYSLASSVIVFHCWKDIKKYF